MVFYVLKQLKLRVIPMLETEINLKKKKIKSSIEVSKLLRKLVIASVSHTQIVIFLVIVSYKLKKFK